MPIGRTVDGGEGEMPRISNALTRDLEELETQLTKEEAPGEDRGRDGVSFSSTNTRRGSCSDN